MNVFDRAAEILDERGVACGQGASKGEWKSGSVCLGLAVAMATPDHARPHSNGRTLDFLRDVIEEHHDINLESGIIGVAFWNDMPGRTEEDLKLVLKVASARWDERE